LTASGNIRNRNAQLDDVLRCLAVQTFIHSYAQFEDDTLGNIQPVKVIVEDVAKTAVEFPCTSDDAGGSVQETL